MVGGRWSEFTGHWPLVTDHSFTPASSPRSSTPSDPPFRPAPSRLWQASTDRSKSVSGLSMFCASARIAESTNLGRAKIDLADDFLQQFPLMIERLGRHLPLLAAC